MKRGSSAKFQKLGGAMAPAGPLPAPPLLGLDASAARDEATELPEHPRRGAREIDSGAVHEDFFF